ncbi:MAG: hypothetical protein HYW90_04000 [Candidatus Sungbacteria bacterium]|nr:hypothetical protein [Candidatus Sungbacteria bacterium]
MRKADSHSLSDWVFWMAVDILKSGYWGVRMRYCYLDTENDCPVAFKREVTGARRKRFRPIDACVLPAKWCIFIDHGSRNKPLCLFHEVMEILFAEWKDRYFVPRRWGLSERSDPILDLEDATWSKLSRAEKAQIARFLPKEP